VTDEKPLRKEPMFRFCDTCGRRFVETTAGGETCPECLAIIIAHSVDDRGEPEEPDEPSGGDFFTYDYRFFFEAGNSSVFDVRLRRRIKVEVPADKDWRPFVKAYMDKQHYWPDVWFIDDHGGCLLLNLED
jgi:hypothetical protein